MSREESIANQFRLKYGSLVTHFGFTQVPNLLLRHQKKLRIKNSDMILVLNLMSYEYDKPISSPAFRTIMRSTGMSSRTIHEAKKRLERLGYLVRNKSKKTQFNTDEKSLTGLTKMMRILARVLIEHELKEDRCSEDRRETLRDLLHWDEGEEHLFEWQFKN